VIPPVDPVLAAAVLLGIAGAVLVAGRLAWVRALGFGCWIVGNLLWVGEGIREQNGYLVVMFAFYLAMAVIGLKNSAQLARVGGGGLYSPGTPK
jgi:hypothetical protein